MDEQLAHYLQLWNLAQPQLLATTPTSHVYTVDHKGETVVLKLLTEYGWEERRGAAALRCFDGHGAVTVYQSDENAQLLEYVAGDDLVSRVQSSSAGDAAATRIIARVLKQLHSVPQTEACADLLSLKTWFQELFARADADEAESSESIFVRGACVARHLLDDPSDVCVLHGDIHHMNIRHSAARGWLAFDPKGLIGERTYDCANTLCNPFRGTLRYDLLVHNEARLLRNAAILSEELAIDLARILAYTYAYSCLSAVWSLGSAVEGDGAAQWALNIARIIEPHLPILGFGCNIEFGRSKS